MTLKTLLPAGQMSERVIRLLEHYSPDSCDQDRLRTRFLEFAGATVDCLSRSCEAGHLTASAWVVQRDAECFLLHHHRALDRWLQLGGHADGSDDLLGTAQREVFEEAGLQAAALMPGAFDLDLHLIPQRQGEPEHLHYDVRFLLAAQGDPICSNESIDVRWLTRDEISRVTQERSVLRMLHKWARMKGR